MLRGQLNRYRYIFDINRLPYSVACITLLIVLTKTLPFWYLTSKHCHSNTVNILCNVSAASFPSVRDFGNSPQKLYLKHEFDKGMRELNKYKKKVITWNLTLKYLLLEHICLRVYKVLTTIKLQFTPQVLLTQVKANIWCYKLVTSDETSSDDFSDVESESEVYNFL